MTETMLVREGFQAEARNNLNVEGVMRQDNRPLYGILSIHRRKKVDFWRCLVCGTSQPSINKACSTCKRDRFPPWLLDVHGSVVLPGSIVRCSRALARFQPPPPPPAGLSLDQPLAATSPRPKGRPLSPPMSRPGSSSPRARALSRTTPPHSPDRAGSTPGRTRARRKQSSSVSPPGRPARRALGGDGTDGTASPCPGVSPRSRGSRAAVPQQSPKANRTVNDNSRTSVSGGGGVVSTTPRRCEKGRAEAEFEAATAAMKSKFEEQLGDCKVMIVAVNGVRPQPPRAPRSLEGYCIMEGDDGQKASRALVKVVLDMTEPTSVEVVDPSFTREEREKFLQFGLCGRCERTYRIEQGWKHASEKKTVEEWEGKARNLSELAAETEEKKKALMAGGGSRADILKASERLKSIRDEIAVTRRFLEPLVVSCPFCLWHSSTLFVADDAEAEGHLEPLGPVPPRAACSSPETVRSTDTHATSPETLRSADTHVTSTGTERRADLNVNPLADVMESLPLKEAFGRFCERALCSESFKFLVEESEFRSSANAAPSTGEHGKELYEEYIAIVDEYIKDNSDSEINIDGRTKKTILSFEEPSSYASLDVEGRSRIFFQAQREVTKMLAENLLSKFKATTEYTELAAKPLSSGIH